MTDPPTSCLQNPRPPTRTLGAFMLLLTDATEAGVWSGVWAFAQQVATFSVALIAIWVATVRPYMAKKEAERKAEIAARDAKRKDDVRSQIEEVVEPIRRQVSAIHRTTTVNGGQNNPPTLRDEVSNVGKQVETAIRAVGAVAVNQAILSERFDHHERDGEKFTHVARAELAKHGIEIPDVASSLPPQLDRDD